MSAINKITIFCLLTSFIFAMNHEERDPINLELLKRFEGGSYSYPKIVKGFFNHTEQHSHEITRDEVADQFNKISAGETRLLSQFDPSFASVCHDSTHCILLILRDATQYDDLSQEKKDLLMAYYALTKTKRFDKYGMDAVYRGDISVTDRVNNGSLRHQLRIMTSRYTLRLLENENSRECIDIDKGIIRASTLFGIKRFLQCAKEKQIPMYFKLICFDRISERKHTKDIYLKYSYEGDELICNGPVRKSDKKIGMVIRAFTIKGGKKALENPHYLEFNAFYQRQDLEKLFSNGSFFMEFLLNGAVLNDVRKDYESIYSEDDQAKYKEVIQAFKDIDHIIVPEDAVPVRNFDYYLKTPLNYDFYNVNYQSIVGITENELPPVITHTFAFTGADLLEGLDIRSGEVVKFVSKQSTVSSKLTTATDISNNSDER
ncbi:MAG: hypothetical protein WCJ92_03785 [Alphaproteobacteria bacterium]